MMDHHGPLSCLALAQRGHHADPLAGPLVGGVEVRQARAIAGTVFSRIGQHVHPMPLEFQSAQKASHAVAPMSHV